MGQALDLSHLSPSKDGSKLVAALKDVIGRHNILYTRESEAQVSSLFSLLIKADLGSVCVRARSF